MLTSVLAARFYLTSTIDRQIIHNGHSEASAVGSVVPRCLSHPGVYLLSPTSFQWPRPGLSWYRYVVARPGIHQDSRYLRLPKAQLRLKLMIANVNLQVVS